MSFTEAQADKLSTFIAISDLSEEVSVGILEANAWNLEIAVEMFMSMNAGDGGIQEQEPLPPPQLQQNSARGAERGLPASSQNNQNSDSESESPPIRASAARDAQYEAHRAALSHHFIDGTGAGDYAGIGGIRAPIPRKKDRLFDPISSRMVMPADPEEAAEKAIEWVFPPPKKILDNRDLDTLCRECSNVPCWLLVNIQDHTVLASHHLNRIWANETIQAIIASNFKLTQMNRSSAKGEFFITRYAISPDELPITVVIDPRTRGIVLKLVGCPSEEGLLNYLADFLDMNDILQPPAIRSNIVRQVSYGGVDEGEGNASNDDEEDDYDYAAETSETSQINSSYNSPIREPEDLTVPPEPMDGDDSATKIQLQLPDGKTVVRRFSLNNSTRDVFNFAKMQVPEANSRAFTLVNFRQELINDKTVTLKDAGLTMSAIKMRWSSTV